MGQILLLLVVALTAAAVVFGVTVLVTGSDPGLTPAEPDGRAVPLPGSRPLAETDVAEVRFDTVVRGYRMNQVDQAMRRAAYDIGYKDELIGVLEAEIDALRTGRSADADALRRARAAALTAAEPAPAGAGSRTENAGPTNGAVPVADAVPVEDAVPVTDAVPMADAVPVEDAVPVADAVPAEDAVPVADPVGAEDAVRTESASPVVRSERG
jgi:DivIVA domain-containing protein